MWGTTEPKEKLQPRQIRPEYTSRVEQLQYYVVLIVYFFGARQHHLH